MMNKRNKIVHLKNPVGKTFRIVREHYLRDDIPCLSKLCLSNCTGKSSTNAYKLPSKDKASHYIIPDCGVAKNFMELLEMNEFKGILFLQTITYFIQHEGSQRLYKTLMSIVHNPFKESAIFYNEFQTYAFCERNSNESITEWRRRSVYKAATWYFNHLAGQISIVILSEDKEMKDFYDENIPNVLILSVKQYLEAFWPDWEDGMQLYESLNETISDRIQIDELSGYLAQEILEAGIKSGRYIQGILNVNRHCANNEAFLRRPGMSNKQIDTTEERDILIRGQNHRNRAIHGDRVVVEIFPKSEWKSRTFSLIKENETQDEDDNSVKMPTGQVIGILQRNWRDYVASFSTDQETKPGNKAEKVIVRPWDWRIPKIRISTKLVSSFRDHKIVVRIDSWETNSQYPNGHFVRSLGKAGDLETEIRTLLLENNINVTAFSESILKEMPIDNDEEKWCISANEVEKRRDLRDTHLVFSIDPEGCEDVDDTLSIKELDNGKLEFGVHIADVTHFVRPRTLTDVEAKERSTSVYLTDRRYDMLPSILSSNLCSLLSGVDRFAVSVIWIMSKNFNVEKIWYGRTIIRSKYKLFYEMAQNISDGIDKETILKNVPELQNYNGEELDKEINTLKWSICKLMEIARFFKVNRQTEGAVELEGSEVKIEVQEERIKNVIPKKTLEIHETIAECMIFANHWVAKKICQHFPMHALLRRHPPPKQENFEALHKCANSRGFTVKTKTNSELAEFLDLCNDPEDPIINRLMRILATMAMSNAEYFSTGCIERENFFHYGLGMEFYTHFTSPIRRYADVVVHRLLMAAVDGSDRDLLLTNQDLQTAAEHMNEKHRAAQQVQRQSQELFQSLFFKEHSSDEFCLVDAVIIQIRNNGFIAFIPRYAIKGAVFLKNKNNQVIEVNEDDKMADQNWVGGSLNIKEDGVAVTTAKKKYFYKLLDHVTVRISVECYHGHALQLNLSLISDKPFIPDIEDEKNTTGQLMDVQSKSELIKAVKELHKTEIVDDFSLGPDYMKWKALYSQTEQSKSLYYKYLTAIENSKLLDL